MSNIYAVEEVINEHQQISPQVAPSQSIVSNVDFDDDEDDDFEYDKTFAQKVLKELITLFSERYGDTVTWKHIRKGDLVRQYSLGAKVGEYEAIEDIISTTSYLLQLGVKCPFSKVEIGVYDNATL